MKLFFSMLAVLFVSLNASAGVNKVGCLVHDSRFETNFQLLIVRTDRNHFEASLSSVKDSQEILMGEYDVNLHMGEDGVLDFVGHLKEGSRGILDFHFKLDFERDIMGEAGALLTASLSNGEVFESKFYFCSILN